MSLTKENLLKQAYRCWYCRTKIAEGEYSLIKDYSEGITIDKIICDDCAERYARKVEHEV